MTPKQIKEAWISGSISEWIEFDKEEIEKSNLTPKTKAFLNVGFPTSAAPFLTFGLKSYKDKFSNLADYYDLDDAYKKYILFGSDGSGNTICFDTSNKDKIVLLDHEEGFQEMDMVNTDISELAECLLAYKNFITRIQNENGEAAFLDSNYNDDQLMAFEEDLRMVNLDILKISGFWRSELRALKLQSKK